MIHQLLIKALCHNVLHPVLAKGLKTVNGIAGGGLQSPHDVNPPPACRTKGGEEIDLPGILDSKTSKGKSTTSSTQQTIDGCCER